jgi:hypothetical protein
MELVVMSVRIDQTGNEQFWEMAFSFIGVWNGLFRATMMEQQ